MSSKPQKGKKTRPNSPEAGAARVRALVESPSYALAFEDHDFIMQHDQRAVRLQLELLKAEMILRRQNIRFTIVAFGGTRIVEPAVAKARLEGLEEQLREKPGDAALERALAVARRVVAKSRYYDEAREFGRLVSESRQRAETDYVIVTGGGPGIMEAANRGAWDADAPSIGLNITLPMEQNPNSYITPELCFQFHYFAIRKMHFLLRAQALVAFPGGYGTLDELFEALTLVQTRKVLRFPIVLVGRDFWGPLVDWIKNTLAADGKISPEDLDLLTVVDTPEDAVRVVCEKAVRP